MGSKGVGPRGWGRRASWAVGRRGRRGGGRLDGCGAGAERVVIGVVVARDRGLLDGPVRAPGLRLRGGGPWAFVRGWLALAGRCSMPCPPRGPAGDASEGMRALRAAGRAGCRCRSSAAWMRQGTAAARSRGASGPRPSRRPSRPGARRRASRCGLWRGGARARPRRPRISARPPRPPSRGRCGGGRWGSARACDGPARRRGRRAAGRCRDGAGSGAARSASDAGSSPAGRRWGVSDLRCMRLLVHAGSGGMDRQPSYGRSWVTGPDQAAR